MRISEKCYPCLNTDEDCVVIMMYWIVVSCIPAAVRVYTSDHVDIVSCKEIAK